MTEEEKMQLIRRASEAGTFDDLRVAWGSSEDGTIREGEIAREVLARANSLLPEPADVGWRALFAALSRRALDDRRTDLFREHAEAALVRRGAPNS